MKAAPPPGRATRASRKAQLSQDRPPPPVKEAKVKRGAKTEASTINGHHEDKSVPPTVEVSKEPPSSGSIPNSEAEGEKTHADRVPDGNPEAELMSDVEGDEQADEEVKAIMANDDQAQTENDDEDDDVRSIDDDEPPEILAEVPPDKPETADPEVVELSDDESGANDDDEDEDDESESEEDAPRGNPDQPPGEGADKTIDSAYLLPFTLGWVREVVKRMPKGQGATQYDVYYVPPPDTKYRTREAKRKRRSKADQEKYFIDFPSEQLSVANFNYVRRPLGLNNAAYEVVRKANLYDPPPQSEGSNKPEAIKCAAKAKNSGGKRQKVSYKEVDESAGLVESDDEFGFEEEKIEFKEGLDLDMPISLQIINHCTAMRTENKKRRRVRDPETCCTPPLAEDMLWSGLVNDPMGVFTDLGGRSSPVTPPPLRAMRLTPLETAKKIVDALSSIKAEAAKVSMEKEPELKEDLASHDLAIRKFRNFVQHANRNTFSKMNDFAAYQPPGSHQLKRQGWTYMKPRSNSDFKVKVKLPMPIINGRRPVVELVMEQNGKYIPIKFSNNMQVTEAIPKSLFEKANSMRKTFYQNATKVPKVGNKPIFLAVNPSSSAAKQLLNPSQQQRNQQRGNQAARHSHQQQQHHHPLLQQLQQKQQKQAQQAAASASHRPRAQGNGSGLVGRPPNTGSGQARRNSSQSAPSRGGASRVGGARKPNQSSTGPSTEQVSILVRPQKGFPAKPVLLNVPRSVAVKVKPGTTLSFSASNDQKYVVIDSKIHPPVGVLSANGAAVNRIGRPGLNNRALSFSRLSQSSNPPPRRNPNIPNGLPNLPNLPNSVSIRPVSGNSSASTPHTNHRGPSVSSTFPRRNVPIKSSVRGGMSGGAGVRRPATGHLRQPPQKTMKTASSVLSSGEVVSGKSPMEPCTPYCPGVQGIPELECRSCQSLFHAKCVGINQMALNKVKENFRCRMCLPSSRGSVSSSTPQVIDLD